MQRSSPHFTTDNTRLNFSADQDSSIKSYWKDLINGKWDSFKGCDCPMTEGDFDKLKLFPIKIYTLDSTTFYSFKKEPELKSHLTLEDSRAEVFALKDSCIVAAVFPEHKDGAWQNALGYGCLPSFSSILIQNFIKKDIPFFRLEVWVYSSIPSPLYRKPMLVYVEKNEFYTYNVKNAKIKLTDYLLQMRRDMVEHPNSLQ